MSVHIILTLLMQLSFALFVKTRASTSLQSYTLLGMACVLVPLVFAPILPITHFLFEFSPPGSIWGYAVLALGLWGLAGSKIRQVPGPQWPVWALWILQGCWIILALAISEYEPGTRTPAFGDAPVYLIHLLSVHLALWLLLTLAWTHKRLRALWLMWLLLYVALSAGALL